MLLRDRVTVVWVVLVCATLVSWESARTPGDHRLATSAILIIAFIKARLIGLDFMELRSAPRPLRVIFEAWVIGGCALLIALYWLTPVEPGHLSSDVKISRPLNSMVRNSR